MTYFRRPVLRELLLQFLCFGFGFSAFMSGFALFAERRFVYHGHPVGVREVGYIFTYFGFLGIFFQGYLLGKLVKRYGEKSLVWFGFLAQGIGYATVGFVFHFPALLLTLIVASFGSGVVRPGLTSLVTQNASREEQGAVLGVTQSLVSMAQVTAPILVGFLINHHWLTSWAMICGGFCLCSLLFSR
jgi:MFS family permease